MTLTIGFLVFPDIQQLDLTGPHEVFSQIGDATVHLVWKDATPVVSTAKMVFTPTTTFAACPPLDVLCIPGGLGINALLEDEAVLTFVRQQAGRARYVTSVCTGSLVLGAAGLLAGRRATSHWLAHDLLSRFGAIPTEARVVRDGTLITAGGITAGIDFGLTVVAELLGREEAERIQLYLEYAPAPPFDAGTPRSAPPALVARIREGAAPGRKAREALIDRIVARGADRVADSAVAPPT